MKKFFELNQRRRRTLVFIFLSLLWPMSVFADSAEAHLVDVGGYRLSFNLTHGSEPTILSECGGMDDSTVWDKVASAVARKTGATILTYDRAGLGKSEPVPGPYKIDNEVTALDRALRSMKLEPLIIVAHSYGGFLAALFSSEHQQQIRGVILIDANLASFFTDERSFQIDGRLGWRTRRVAKSWCGKGESAGCVARDGAANAQCRIPRRTSRRPCPGLLFEVCWD
jgi:pimeloyl-ACP methyl ester carboxylesterase